MTHDPAAGKKLRDVVTELGDTNSDETSIDAIVARFFPDTDINSRMVEIVFDLVFRYFLLIGSDVYESLRDESGNVNTRAFDEVMDRFIQRNTKLEEDQRRRLRQNVKQAVLASTSIRPKRRTREKLLNRQRDRLCYLCGLEICSDQDQVLDHRWPLSAGGGTGSANLYRAHKHCEEIKADIAFATDTAFGRIAYRELPRLLEEPANAETLTAMHNADNATTYLDDVRSAQMRVGVLQRQNHACRRCKQEFRDVGKAVLTKRDETEPWWFNNIEAVCEPCNKEGQKNA